MSYARCIGDSQFYAFQDSKSGLLQIFFSNKIRSHTCGILINLKEAEHLMNIIKRYIVDVKNEKDKEL